MTHTQYAVRFVDLLCLESSSEVLYNPLLLFGSPEQQLPSLEQRQFSTICLRARKCAFIGYTENFVLVSKIKPWGNITAWPIKIGLTCGVESTIGTIHGIR